MDENEYIESLEKEIKDKDLKRITDLTEVKPGLLYRYILPDWYEFYCVFDKTHRNKDDTERLYQFNIEVDLSIKDDWKHSYFNLSENPTNEFLIEIGPVEDYPEYLV